MLLVPRWGQRADRSPKSAQPGARTALAEICNAEGREHSLIAVQAFPAGYGDQPAGQTRLTVTPEDALQFVRSAWSAVTR